MPSFRRGCIPATRGDGGLICDLRILNADRNIMILLRAGWCRAAVFGVAKTTFCTGRAPDVAGKCPTTSPNLPE
jgi:hypothetical protein